MLKDTIDMKGWGRWMAGFLGFPLAGVAARAVAGPIDDLSAAVVGGLAAGATLGAVQALARRSEPHDRLRWVLVSSIGLSAGLAVGAAGVDYGTSTGDLIVMGAITGAGVGLAQATVLPTATRRRIAWALATPALWALGWAVTANVIVDADQHHAMFGSSGALLVAALSGLLLVAGHDRMAA